MRGKRLLVRHHLIDRRGVHKKLCTFPRFEGGHSGLAECFETSTRADRYVVLLCTVMSCWVSAWLPHPRVRPLA